MPNIQIRFDISKNPESDISLFIGLGYKPLYNIYLQLKTDIIATEIYILIQLSIKFIHNQVDMSQTQRNTKLRLLFKKLNKERKRQAEKIDILCNDLIAAHRVFIKKLDAVGTTAQFYKSILGSRDWR